MAQYRHGRVLGMRNVMNSTRSISTQLIVSLSLRQRHSQEVNAPHTRIANVDAIRNALLDECGKDGRLRNDVDAH
jgi:hypothetical protein